jgi:hypothetical protein
MRAMLSTRSERPSHSTAKRTAAVARRENQGRRGRRSRFSILRCESRPAAAGNVQTNRGFPLAQPQSSKNKDLLAEGAVSDEPFSRCRIPDIQGQYRELWRKAAPARAELASAYLCWSWIFGYYPLLRRTEILLHRSRKLHHRKLAHGDLAGSNRRSATALTCCCSRLPFRSLGNGADYGRNNTPHHITEPSAMASQASAAFHEQGLTAMARRCLRRIPVCLPGCAAPRRARRWAWPRQPPGRARTSRRRQHCSNTAAGTYHPQPNHMCLIKMCHRRGALEWRRNLRA